MFILDFTNRTPTMTTPATLGGHRAARPIEPKFGVGVFDPSLLALYDANPKDAIYSDAAHDIVRAQKDGGRFAVANGDAR